MESMGYRKMRATMINDPEPTEVIPTMSPPTSPMATVGIGFSRKGAGSPERPASTSAWCRRSRRICSAPFTTMEPAAKSSTTPSKVFSRDWT